MSAIKHFLVIETPPGKVYQALTMHEGISNWWTPQNKIGEKSGDTNIFDFGNRYHNEMKIVKLEPNKQVEWACLVGDKEWVGTNILFSMEEVEKSTALRFSHFNWREETDFFASCNYQWGYYLMSLKLYCETGKGMPFKE
jgi:uncharacterized protein YndB with AHSA1/START domain